MKKMHRSQGGFTLVEILIVLALLGILLAVVIPNLTGFLGRGKDQSYAADSRTIQAAVDAYYTDTTLNCGAAGRCFPTLNGVTKVPTGTSGNPTSGVTGNDYYVNMTNLVTRNLLRDVPQSASSNNVASGTTTGSYSWFIDAKGVVSSTWVSGPTELGYKSGVYP